MRDVEEVVRGDVDGSHDPLGRPSPRSSTLTQPGACSKCPRNIRSPVSAYERIARLTPPWRTASAVSQLVVCEQALEGGEDAVEELADRLSAEEPLLVRDHAAERVDELALERVRRNLREAAALDLAQLGPGLRLAAGRDDCRGLERAREAAAEHAVELDAGERRCDALACSTPSALSGPRADRRASRLPRSTTPRRGA